MAQIKAFAFVFLFPIFVLAQNVYVSPVTGRGVSADDLATITDLLKIAVDKNGGYTSVDNEKSATIILKGNVLKLGESLILAVSKETAKGKRFSSEMKASSLEDMDVVTTRIVRSVLTETTPKESVKVTEVTQHEETAGTRRYQATRQWQFGFGPAWSNNLSVDGAGTNWSIGFAWGLDPQYDLALMWDFYVDRDEDDARFHNLSVGINYLLNLEKHAPFITADIGYGSAEASDGCDDGGIGCTILSDDEASGWVASVGAGYKFFRTSSVNLGVVARYSHMFDKTSKSDETPSMTSVRIVIYW